MKVIPMCLALSSVACTSSNQSDQPYFTAEAADMLFKQDQGKTVRVSLPGKK